MLHDFNGFLNFDSNWNGGGRGELPTDFYSFFLRTCGDLSDFKKMWFWWLKKKWNFNMSPLMMINHHSWQHWTEHTRKSYHPPPPGRNSLSAGLVLQVCKKNCVKSDTWVQSSPFLLVSTWMTFWIEAIPQSINCEVNFILSTIFHKFHDFHRITTHRCHLAVVIRQCT